MNVPMQSRQTGRRRWQVRLVALCSAALVSVVCGSLVAQDFQIVWVVVGEAEATAGNRPARAGRHLFMASELMTLSMKNVKVSRIEVAPAVTQLTAGVRLCVSSLNIIAYDNEGAALERAPLSISVRQDQKQKLALTREKNDICVSPSEAGEYPMRFASLLPARDGTTRGAQIFLRVTAPDVAAVGNVDSASVDGVSVQLTYPANPMTHTPLAPDYARHFVNYPQHY